MKRIFLLLNTIIIYSNSVVAQFNTKVPLSNTLSNGPVLEIQYGDIDNDGDLDYVGGFSNGEFYWFKNVDSSFSYFQPILIDKYSYSTFGIDKILLVDVNNDNYLDIVKTELLNQRMYVYLNDMTNRAFSPNTNPFKYSNMGSVINSSFSIIKSGDINGDGLTDVIVGNEHGLWWLKNIGGGYFNTAQIIYPVNWGLTYDMADMDSDNDLDIIIIESGYMSKWLENDSNGIFTPHQINDMKGTSIKITDIDGDSLLDIISSGQNRLDWYEHVSDSIFTKQKLDSNTINGSIYICDRDGDLDKDIFLCGSKMLICYENQGDTLWTIKDTIYETTNTNVNITNFIVEDFDMDSKSDILTGIHYTNGSSVNYILGWYKNLPNGSFDDYKYLENRFEQVQPFTNFPCVDIDNDGDKDIMGYQIWLENDGMQHFRIKTYGDDQIESFLGLEGLINSVYSSDIDGDNDFDIISIDINKKGFFWKDNSGNGSFIVNHDFQYNYDFLTIQLGDIDNDGDDDIVATTYVNSSSNEIYLFINTNGSFSNGQLLYSMDNVQNLRIHDIDSDGDKDIFFIGTSNSIENAYAIINQVGSMSSSPINMGNIYNGIWHNRVEFIDVDNDNKSDLVGVQTNKLVWYKNITGTSFGSEQVIYDANTSYSHWLDFNSGDFNSDGNIDFLINDFGNGGDSLIWIPNLGNGIFNASITLNNNSAFGGVYGEDMDSDGDIDILTFGRGSGVWLNRNISWLENFINIPAPIGIDKIIDINSNVTLYPNPTVDKLFIKSPLFIKKIEIINITGGTIKSIKNTSNSVNLSGLSNGIYFIKLVTDEGTITRKFVKQ